MLRVFINGKVASATDDESVLQLLYRQGVKIPTLCNDPRLAPIGGCRLCSVTIEGQPKLITSCTTAVTPDMAIITHSPEIEHFRRMTLRAITNRLSSSTFDYSISPLVETELGRWLRHYGVTCSPNEDWGNAAEADQLSYQVDKSHPYLDVDMRRCISCLRCVRICEDVQGQFVWRTEGRGSQLRIVTSAGRSLLESGCVSCGACADTCPSGAIADLRESDFGQGVDEPKHETTRTTCHYCGVGCEMDVDVADDRVVSIRPALDSPVNKGHLCVKGRYGFQYVDAADRVTTPLVRRGEALVPCSWDVAYGEILSQLQSLKSQFGGRSLAMLASARATNEENYLTQKFARIVLESNNVDCCARVCHTPTAAAMKLMLGTGAATNSFDDIESASSFLLCGTNATENHPVVGARIRQRVLNGSALVVIDPRKTELAGIATVHLALRPGTNVPLLNSIAAVIVREHLCDNAFISTRVNGFEDYQTFVRDYAPERVAETCGVAVEQIEQAARIYALQKPAMCFHGLGVTEHAQGTEAVMCLVNLALLTGNLGKLGSGVNPLRGQNNVQGSAVMGCEPSLLTGSVLLSEHKARFEAVWGAKIPETPGLHMLQMLDAAVQGDLKALWVIGYDLLFTNANRQSTEQALAALQFVVVQDFFVNETARKFASVFLPAVTGFEKDGTYMNSERRISRVRRLLSPRGESKPDWQILCELATRWGKDAQFQYPNAESIWDEVRMLWPHVAGISYSRLGESRHDEALGSGGLQWPCPDLTHPGTKVLHVDSFAIGKCAELQQIQFVPSPENTDVDYPLLLTTGRSLYQFNSGTMSQRTPNRRMYSPDLLVIHPEDARSLGVETGAMVKIVSKYGEARLPALISESVKRGELFTTFHSTENWVNNVTSTVRDNRVGTPEYKLTAVRVEVERLKAAEAGN